MQIIWQRFQREEYLSRAMESITTRKRRNGRHKEKKEKWKALPRAGRLAVLRTMPAKNSCSVRGSQVASSSLGTLGCTERSFTG